MKIEKFPKILMVTVLVFYFMFSIGQITFAAGPAGVNLGAAGDFVILAKTGISTTGITSVGGDIGVSPAAATFITGFGLTLPAAGAFSTSALVSGKVYAPGYANPTPANMTTAISNMETAYTDAMGRTNPTAIELGAGNIGGMTLAPGLYKWGTGVTIPTNVTLSGGANDVWIFQIAQNLNISSATEVNLSGGAQSSNIFWAVAGQATLGTTSVFSGNILSQTAIVLNTGATLNGRALAQSAVTLDSSSVTIPTGSSSSSSSSSASNNSNNNTSSTNASTSLSASNSSNNSSNTGTANNSTDSITPETGCSVGNLYNTSTGALCVNTIARVAIAGCDNRATGFSTASGQTCVGNSVSAIARARYNFGLTTLRNGSRGEAVMELQRFLNARLNLGLVVDGKLGPRTIAVIKTWQGANGLVADGLIGVRTKAQMNAEAQN